MVSLFSAPRRVRTSLVCPDCGSPLDIRRSCHKAFMFCSECSKEFPLEPFIPHMDDAMETFLEQLFADRI